MTQGKADAGKRIVAAVIDSIIALFLGFILGVVLSWLPFLGGLIAGLVSAAYIGFRDALPIGDLAGASPGKKLLGLKAVRGDGRICDYETSLKRNSPFVAVGALSALLTAIPILGWLVLVLLIPVFFIVYIFELVKVLNDARGIRWGDSFADTVVIEVGSGQSGDSSASPPPPPPPGGQAPPPPEESAPPPPPPAEETSAEESSPTEKDVAPPPEAAGQSGQDDAFKPPEAPWKEGEEEPPSDKKE